MVRIHQVPSKKLPLFTRRNREPTIIFCYTLETRAAPESTFSNRGHAIGNRDASQTSAMLKCIISDRGDTFGNNYACQT